MRGCGGTSRARAVAPACSGFPSSASTSKIPGLTAFPVAAMRAAWINARRFDAARVCNFAQHTLDRRLVERIGSFLQRLDQRLNMLVEIRLR